MSEADDIARKAYFAWELHEFDEAAELFRAAAESEAEAAKKRSPWAKPDSSHLLLARSAFCLWEAGRNEQARPLLEATARLDFRALRTWGDRCDASTAFTYLMLDLAAAGDSTGFQELSREATDRCRILEMTFPLARPHKRMLIAACIEMNDRTTLRRIVDELTRDDLKNPELKLAAARAHRFLDNQNCS